MAPDAPRRGNQTSRAAEIHGHVAQRRDDAGQQIKRQVTEVAHAVFHVVAEDPQEPHVSQDVGDAGMHEYRRDQRQINRDGRGLQAGHQELITARRIGDHMIGGDHVLAGSDFGGHGGQLVADFVVGAEALENDEHEHIDGDDRVIDDRRKPPIGIVVAQGEDHLGVTVSGMVATKSPGVATPGLGSLLIANR